MISSEKAHSLIREAKHSFAILLGFVGDTDSPANRVLLKWPDVTDALLDGDEERFNEAAAYLICYPMKLVAESLRETIRKLGEDVELYVVEVNKTMESAATSPVDVKLNLIRLCNTMIFRLQQLGIHHEYVKSVDGVRP